MSTDERVFSPHCKIKSCQRGSEGGRAQRDPTVVRTSSLENVSRGVEAGQGVICRILSKAAVG